MIGEIVNAILQEAKALFAGKAGTVILRTQFKMSKIDNYKPPFLMLDVIDAPDSYQFIGGSTMMGWDFGFNTYSHEPDSSVDNDTDSATDLLNFIDIVRRHFTKGIWLTPGMAILINNYSFKFTLSGIHAADALDGDGLVMGYKIMLESVSIDEDTDSIIESLWPLEFINQIQNLIQVMSFPNRALSPVSLLNVSAGMSYQIAAGVLVDSICMSTVSGNPTISIGTTPGGTDIVNAVQPGLFNKTVVGQLYDEDATYYITITGGGAVNISILQVNNLYQ